MSRLYEALRKSELETQQKGAAGPVMTEVVRTAEAITATSEPLADVNAAGTVQPLVSVENHLVAFSEPQGLPAEKFRVLVTRLDNLRAQKEIKSLQVTSSVVDEGKTLVAANLAVTLARHAQNRVLLIEGDLHNPALRNLLGIKEVKGLTHWWAENGAPIGNYVYRVGNLPLWFLPAGARFDEPSEILQSGRLAEAISQLAASFDWIIVDSTPLAPMADANIWNRIVDGMLLVVREGHTPVKALKRGLASLDNPKLVGVVLNGAKDFDRVNYYDQYYAAANRRAPRHPQPSQSPEVPA